MTRLDSPASSRRQRPRRGDGDARATRPSCCCARSSRSRRSSSGSTSSSSCSPTTGRGTSRPWVNDLVARHRAPGDAGRRRRSRSPPASWSPSGPASAATSSPPGSAGIILNLVTMGDYLDVALRDFGLLVGALALARLAVSSAAATAPGRTMTEQRAELSWRPRVVPRPVHDRPGRAPRPPPATCSSRWVSRRRRPPGRDATPDGARLRRAAQRRGLRPTTFPNDEGYDELVLVEDIPLRSVCEHHMLPFVGVAHVGYLPGERILGLSKFARLVEFFSHRAADPGAADQAGRRAPPGPPRAPRRGGRGRGRAHVHEPARRARDRCPHRHLDALRRAA